MVSAPIPEDEAPPIPPGVVLIARRNQRTHYLLPTKDSSFCGIPCEHVMINSGCNTVLLPFPNDTRVLDRFTTYFEWTIITSSGTGTIHSPVLKISNVMDNVGVMDLPVFGFQAPMPFLRFHLGSEECRWLLQNHPQKIGPRGRSALESFLQRVGDAGIIPGRAIALLGQMILKDLCVFQFGKVMYAMRLASTDVNMNPFQIGIACLSFANYHVVDFDEFHDLHDNDIDLYDVEGDMPVEQD